MAFRHAICIDTVDARPIRAAGGSSPRMALGTMPTRPALLLRIEDTQGCEGWGEIWANFPPRANLHKAHLVEDVVARHLKGMRLVDPREATAMLREKLSVFFLHVGQTQVFEHILAGIDTALWDLALRSAGTSFAAHMGLDGAAARSYATSINAEDLEELIPRHAGLGQTHFKLKIGFAGHGTADIVGRAAALCPRGARLMVDSNQSWTLPQARRALAEIEPFDPYFAEEPLRADAPLADWEALAAASAIPLAGGENVYGQERFLAMAGAGLRVLQPDVAKWGGVSGALDLAAAAPDGVLIWPHFMGTAVGQLAALAVTAALGPEAACEIDVNENALRTELCGDAIAIRDGAVALPGAPGLVVPPDPAALARFADAP